MKELTEDPVSIAHVSAHCLCSETWAVAVTPNLFIIKCKRSLPDTTSLGLSNRNHYTFKFEAGLTSFDSMPSRFDSKQNWLWACCTIAKSATIFEQGTTRDIRCTRNVISTWYPSICLVSSVWCVFTELKSCLMSVIRCSFSLSNAVSA